MAMVTGTALPGAIDVGTFTLIWSAPAVAPGASPQ
jgi:hypothetical protein